MGTRAACGRGGENDRGPPRVVLRGGPLKRCRRRPTLPRPLGRSTIGAAGLNGRVRDGNGCGPCALVASDLERSDGLRSVGVAPRDARRRANIRVLCSWCLGVIKPHGRLGPLRSEGLASRPRAAYRRGGLPRPFRSLKGTGRVHLGDGFPLRCVQRLSVPIIATRRCPWQDSRDTSGSSDSVLSY